MYRPTKNNRRWRRQTIHLLLERCIEQFCYRQCQGCKRDVEVQDRDETETFGFQFETRPRSRPSHFSRDRDRDRDVQFWVRDETETLIGRDRDIFRDLGMLSYI